ncbi:MAG: hypothetical protein EOM50_24270 [Erysipelotrichia bacterium]|nr:hypothetical protein [Erysipelotrichia bacterium]
MIPEKTFEEFANNLFGYTKVPLESRGWITAKENKQFSYCYTWGEIEDYISRWLEKVQASRLDDEVNQVFKMLNNIVDNWYQINFNNPTGRCGYDDDIDPYISELDWEEFELLDRLKEYIYKRAREAKGIKTVDFEDYLLCSEEQKQPLMEKLEQLYRTAEARDAFIIYKALEQIGYIATKERGKQEVYDAINIRFGKNWKNQNYQGHKKNTELFRSEIEEVGRELKS